MEDIREFGDFGLDGRGTPGIVIRDSAAPPMQPRISAFIWGGKVRPVPTLPFGRWKPQAA